MYRYITYGITLFFGIVAIAFAINNHDAVNITLPFIGVQYIAPLFLVLFAMLVTGIFLGYLLAWNKARGLRRESKKLLRKIDLLENEIAGLRAQPMPMATPAPLQTAALALPQAG